MRRPISICLALPLALPILGPPSLAARSIADRVTDGPAATLIRESLRDLERGENAEDEAKKIEWYQRGKALAERALEADERSADAHFAYFANWGHILQTDGWLKNSVYLPALWRELDRALELDPDHADALAAKGGLYLRLPAFLGGDVDKAERLLQRAADLDPEAAGIRLELSECYLQKSQPEAARRLLQTSLRLAREQGKERYVRRAESLLRDLDAVNQSAPAAGSVVR